jgi:hypothetical protein
LTVGIIRPILPAIKEGIMERNLAAILLFACAVFGAQAIAAESAATEKEKDGWTIFDLSYQDASIKAKAKYIAIVEDEGGRSIEYSKLRLSCGTYMTGSLREAKVGGKTTLKGTFEVSSNPYGIKILEVDLAKESVNAPWAGFLVVDGVKVSAEDARGF